MSIWTQPSPSDFDRWEQKLADGVEPREAAAEIGYTCSAFRRANPARHAECLAVGREARDDSDRVLARATLRAICEDDEAPHAARVSSANTLSRTSRWLSDRVEVTGAEGGPVEVLNPDVEQAIERFTAAIVPLSARAGAAGAVGGAAAGSEGGAGVQVAGMAGETEPASP